MNISRTRDKKAILKILKHPDVNHWVTDDLSPENFTPIIHDAIIYLMDDKKTGVIRIEPMNGICCQGHVATLPEMWGQSVEFARLAVAWIFKATRYMKIVGMVPEYNQRALEWAKASGMMQEGVITKAFLKDMKLHNLIVFGLCKHKEE